MFFKKNGYNYDEIGRLIESKNNLAYNVNTEDKVVKYTYV